LISVRGTARGSPLGHGRHALRCAAEPAAAGALRRAALRAAGCLRAAGRFGKPASDAGASLARAGHAVRSRSVPVREAQRSCVAARRQLARPRSR
jgi:hypothetical protein